MNFLMDQGSYMPHWKLPLYNALLAIDQNIKLFHNASYLNILIIEQKCIVQQITENCGKYAVYSEQRAQTPSEKGILFSGLNFNNVCILLNKLTANYKGKPCMK